MVIALDTTTLYSTFNVENFEQLEKSTQVIAPSMVEYYLSDLASANDDGESYINKTNIQQTIFLDEYSLYLDYSDNIYLEFEEKQSEYETESLW